MKKRTIIKWWLAGLVIQVAGMVLATVMAIVMAAHIVDLTIGNRNFVPDTFFWTTIVLLILSGLVFTGGSLAQLVAQVGAILNTHRLEDRTWFRALLYSTIASNLVLFATLGLQLGLGAIGSPVAGLVWPGYIVGGLIGFVSIVSYMVAGPDGMAHQHGDSTIHRATAGTEGLAQA